MPKTKKKFKEKINIILFTSSLFIGITIGTITNVNALSINSCSVANGNSSVCTNNITGNDSLAYFKNTKRTNFRADSPYKIRISDITVSPTVTRGAPVYRNLVVHDNKNSTYYTYSSWNGYYLNDYGFLSRSIARTLDFYPAPDEKPITHLIIRSADGFDCLTKPLSCNSYDQVSELNVR